MTTNNGRIYLIGLKGTSHSYVLTNLQHDVFHGLRCLKGIARSSKAGNWIESKRVYVPFEQISDITEFETWADYLAGARQSANDPPAKTPAAIIAKPKPPKKSKRRR